MHIVVYLDLFFLINFIVDFYGLLLSGIWMGQRIKWFRLTGGAIFGAGMLLPFMMCPDILMGIKGIIWWTGISMGATWIALGKKGGLLRKWALTTTILVLIGGIMNGLRSQWKMDTLSLGIWLFFFMGSAGAVILLLSGRKEVLHRRNTIYPMEIHHGDRRKRGNIFLDTGNRLWDGLFGKPVIILSYHFLSSVLTMEEVQFVKDYQEEGCINYSQFVQLKTQKRVCFHEITYQSVGNPSGRLLCFLADEIVLPKQKQTLRRQPVAIVMDSLFATGEYDGLLFADGVE